MLRRTTLGLSIVVGLLAGGCKYEVCDVTPCEAIGGSGHGGGGAASTGGGGSGGVPSQGGSGDGAGGAGGSPNVVSVDVTFVGAIGQPLPNRPILVAGPDGVAEVAGNTATDGTITVDAPPDGSIIAIRADDGAGSSVIVAYMQPQLTTIQLVDEESDHVVNSASVTVQGNCPDCPPALGHIDFFASCALATTSGPQNGTVTTTFAAYGGCPKPQIGKGDFIAIVYDDNSNPLYEAHQFDLDFTSGNVALGAFSNATIRQVQFVENGFAGQSGYFAIGRRYGHAMQKVASGSATIVGPAYTKTIAFPDAIFDGTYAYHSITNTTNSFWQRIAPFNGVASTSLTKGDLASVSGSYTAGTPARVDMTVDGPTGDVMGARLYGSNQRVWSILSTPSATASLILPTLPAQFSDAVIDAPVVTLVFVEDIDSVDGYDAALAAGVTTSEDGTLVAAPAL